MAEFQGAAEISVRSDAALFVSLSSPVGWIDASGVHRGSLITDWDAFTEVVSFGLNVGALGATLRRALLASRIQMSREWSASQRAAGDYDVRVARAFGKTSARGLFSGMRNAIVDWSLGRIVLGPTRHKRGSAFEGFPTNANAGHEDVSVSFDATDAELGVAIRECISRCL